VRVRGPVGLRDLCRPHPESEKVAHYNLADVFVMPSYGEGFGIALIEAAACGIPIVGSSADGSEAITAAMRGAQRRARNDLVEGFDVSRFRARVAHWMKRQAALAAA
jgi:glycosyltransferase involved in cell wall biosynthesis